MKALGIVGLVIVGLVHSSEANAAPAAESVAAPGIAVAAGAANAGLPDRVLAQAEDDSGDAAPTVGRRWYGWQILIADGASWLVMLMASIAEPASYVGTAGYFLGGPIVHWAHARVGIGFASLGLRVAMPGAGMLAGWVLGFVVGSGGDSSDSEGFWGGFLVGAVFAVIGGALGVLGAQVIDIAALAWENVRPEVVWKDDEQRMRALAETPRLAISPILAPRHDGGFAGLAVSF